MNLATERATAKPSVTVPKILGAVEAAGYDARLMTSTVRNPLSRWVRWLAATGVAMIGLRVLIVSPSQRP